MSDNKSGDKVKELYFLVKAKKREIEKIKEKTNWVTNCAFRFDTDAGNVSVINIQTVTNVHLLISISGWLLWKEECFKKGLAELGLPEQKFTWLGYSVEDWIEDVKSRLNKITINDKKKELAALESKLEPLLTEEFKRELALEEIMNSDVLK